MAGVSVRIQPNMLTWIIRKLQFQEVGSSVLDTLHQWQSGAKVPTFSQIEAVSRKTNMPLGYFFLEEPPKDECEIVDYRTVNSISVDNPSRNLIDTVDAMSAVQEWMADYYRTNGNDPFSYVGRFTERVKAQTIATDIRKELGIEKEWFLNAANAADSFRIIRKRLEQIGILVMMNGIVGNNTHRKLDVNEFRAFTLADKQAPLIFINSCDSDNGKIFSLFHELAHVWLGKDSFYNEPVGNVTAVSKLEVLCNAAAAELIAPKDIFIAQWDKTNEDTNDAIDDLAKYFRCSRFVIARRALNADKISAREFSAIEEMLTRQIRQLSQEEKKSSGGDFYKTLSTKWDHNFISALSQSAKSGKTLYTDVYHLTGTTGKTFAELVSRQEGV